MNDTMWNKTAQDLTYNQSFVTNGADNATRPVDYPEPGKNGIVRFDKDNGELGTLPMDEPIKQPEEDDGATEIDEDVIDGKKVRPVVGWLVCTRGEDLGKDFHLYSGYNTIGRGDEASQITVKLSDRSVSRGASLVLSYDPLYNEYILSKSLESETVCRYEKRMIHGSIELKAYDRVTLGKREEVELMFIPLCGEKFCWEEDKKE